MHSPTWQDKHINKGVPNQDIHTGTVYGWCGAGGCGGCGGTQEVKDTDKAKAVTSIINSFFIALFFKKIYYKNYSTDTDDYLLKPNICACGFFLPRIISRMIWAAIRLKVMPLPP